MTPTVSPEVSLRNLKRGDDIRLKRAEFRREVAGQPRADGLITVAVLLEHHKPPLPRYLETMKLGYALRSVRRIGQALLDSIYRDAQFTRNPHDLRISDLTDDERERLAEAIRARVPKVKPR